MEGSIDVLLQRGADPNTSDIPLPPIVYAICAGDVNGVIRLLAKGARVHSTLTHEVSPVRNKIKMGRVEGREEGREREKMGRVEGREEGREREKVEGRGGGGGGRGGGREEGEEGGRKGKREEGREGGRGGGREEGEEGGRKGRREGGRGGGRKEEKEEGEEGGKTYILFSSRHSWEAARC